MSTRKHPQRPAPPPPPPVPSLVVTGARVSIDLARSFAGFVAAPLNLARTIELVDVQGEPLPAVDLRAELHRAVDEAVEKLEAMRAS